MLLLLSAAFFKINFFKKKSFRNTIRVSNDLKLGPISGLTIPNSALFLANLNMLNKTGAKMQLICVFKVCNVP